MTSHTKLNEKERDHFLNLIQLFKQKYTSHVQLKRRHRWDKNADLNKVRLTSSLIWEWLVKWPRWWKEKYKSAKKNTVETILDTRLSELIKITDKKLDKIVEELEKSREEGKEQIMGGIEDIVQILSNK